MGSLFTLRGVGLVAAGTTILRDVTVSLPDVAVSMILGPSGSGKSTLLRLLNGLERPTHGSVSFRGEDLSTIDVRGHRRRVGMVFQRPIVFDGTSAENLQVADPSLTPDQMLAALRRVGLDGEHLDRDARDLSGGEAQRLCLARTLATKPDVVLMDEPTSALDQASVHLIEHLVGEIAAAGVRFIWVSHDQAQVKRLANWIGRMDAGVLVESGPSDAVGHVHGDGDTWHTATTRSEADQ